VARVFVTRELPGQALERLATDHDVDLWPGREAPPFAELCERTAGAEGLLCMLTDSVGGELFDAAQGLRAVSTMAVGTDNIDLREATRRGIPVGHTPDVLTDTTADLAVALMLAAARRLPEGEAAVRAGEWGPWHPSWMLGRDLHGATVGIVGMGRIGQAVTRRLEGFGVTVLEARRDGLDRVLAESDFVSLHCPLTDETRGLIDASALGAMRDDAVLVNTARGPIVDTGALAEALTNGEIAAAALDVTDPEPLPADHPLLGAPNLIVLPHVGSATDATREAMADLAADNLAAALRGERMPHPANSEVYD
jgi:lactate dehydrogenase-like 2-hydroxyacid dehydrogenase